ncbi:MAG: CoA-binding protein [Candidatus Bathyarchaeota archaeon B26-2]|nr:MAG: CoA-binding protein [Candidatus Bathyarchaeota archaeon B26-2]
MEPDLIAEFVDRRNVIAVVGASRNPEKYGHKVYKDLKEAGYKVYPVNPNASEILGDRCYPSLRSLPERPDVVTVVVPPRVTEEVVKTCKDLGISKVWMQPGSESDRAIQFCRDAGIKVVHGVCIIVQRRV